FASCYHGPALRLNVLSTSTAAGRRRASVLFLLGAWKAIAASVANIKLTVLDGEIVCLDRKGKSQFKNLMFHRGNPPCFFAFDLLICDGKDLRTERLMDRKQALFQRVCELDLEGIVAKQKSAPYVTEREQSTWFK